MSQRVRAALFCLLAAPAWHALAQQAEPAGRSGQAAVTAPAATAGQAGSPADAPASDSRTGHYTLSSAWRATLQFDPTYQAAIAEREAGQANRAIGRSGLLPQVSASLGRNRIRGTLEQPNARGDTVSTDLNYTSKTNEIRATQTVFNWSTFAEYRQGQARADYSLAVFDTRADDTAERLINRYFQALLSYERVVLSRNNLQANERQVQVAQRRFDAGEGTVTDIREAQSWRDLAVADLIAAEDALVVAQRELQEMLGATPVSLAGLKPVFATQPLQPATREDWLALAMQNNPEIRTGQQGLRISEEEIDRTFGGHLPTLDIVAARRDVTSDTLSTRNQESATTSIGFQLQVPLFSGGLTHAQVTQARYNRDRSSSELAATRERIAVEVTRQYQAVVSGAQRTAALKVAVESSELALEAVQKGYEAGTRSIVDILDAQEQLYRARLDLTQARLEYVQARLMLASAAGQLNAEAIDTVTQQFFGRETILLTRSGQAK